MFIYVYPASIKEKRNYKSKRWARIENRETILRPVQAFYRELYKRPKNINLTQIENVIWKKHIFNVNNFKSKRLIKKWLCPTANENNGYLKCLNKVQMN